LRCQDEVFKVHRAIVCFRSAVLVAAIKRNFKEGQTKEIDLSANDPEAVESMIEYLYPDDYHNPEIDTLAATTVEQTLGEGASATAKSITSTSNPFLFNVKVYILADQYNVPGLKSLAKAKHEQISVTHWNSTLFCVAAGLLWPNTVESDRQLRDSFIRVAEANIEEMVSTKEWAEVANKWSDLSFAVLESVVEKYVKGVRETMTSKQAKKPFRRQLLI
ncbi:hypothetical protein B0J14DRAFT_490538, partial [Halenospora varia]